MQLKEIILRDPYVLVHDGKYYLYGTRSATCWGETSGFDVYVSGDLINWSEPQACFENDGSFWADRNYWAPEVHVRNGKFYMFASFKSEGVCRGTAVLCADTPLGPFVPHSNGCVTPKEWECLDGTYYEAKDGKSYMVFSHEWVQAGDGEICAVALTDDLSSACGEPFVLFRASDAKWSKRMRHSSSMEGYVTDGPFLWRSGENRLMCIWAGFSDNGYTEGIAISDNGEVDGKFRQALPLFDRDGGHGMLFRSLSGQLMLTLHSPNTHLEEHPRFIPLTETADGSIKCM